MKRLLSIAALLVVAGVLMVPATSFYFESGKGARCTSCHEMAQVYDQWRTSSHRDIGCGQCHGQALNTDVSFHLNNIERAYSHVRNDQPERVGFGNKYVQAITGSCKSCHRQEYAAWKSGPHSATYARIFLDKKHNTDNLLMDDCLRCHGANFEGGIGDLVTPVNRTGPWRIKGRMKDSPDLANMPTMPCTTCHQVHRPGSPMNKAGQEGRLPGPAQEISRPSLALYDRRTGEYIPVSDMPIPAMLDGARSVKVSGDQRQALCYQCHAPTSTRQVASGDDRTGIGVHEGIGCLGCHSQHGQKTRASCASCHPKMSNCGLDVEKMNTTFTSAGSKNNIHWVKCADCHAKGVPPKKARTLANVAGYLPNPKVEIIR